MTGISPIGNPGAARPAGDGGQVGSSRSALPFADLVNDLLKDTNNRQMQVGDSVRQLVTGETESIHDVVLTASQADMAFRLTMEIRDRLIESYKEIMRMQL